MTPELTDDDKAILATLLREAIERDRFPLSPRVRSFKAILAKLDPRPPVDTLPAPKPPGERSMALTRKRQRWERVVLAGFTASSGNRDR